MPIQELNGLRFFTFSGFPSTDIVQGIFTRQGGVSQEHWRSLNLGGTNGDSRNHVIENRRRIFETLNREVESIFDVWQVHGTDSVCAEQPRALESPHWKADIILTDRTESPIHACDFFPIFLYTQSGV